MVVTGTVLAVQIVAGPSWLPRTRVTLQSDRGPEVQFLLPGANGGPPAAVLGVPVIEPGQRWTIELDQAAVGLVPRGHGLGMTSLDPKPVWNLNGNHLPDDMQPWPFYMNEDGIEALGADTTEDIFEDSLNQWSNVACSTFAFDYQGRTEAMTDDDGMNAVAWENDEWEWHADAAAMSIVRFDLSGDLPSVRETDILFNAVDWDWDADTGTTNAVPPQLHAGSVVTHELGHSTGLDHEYFYVTSSMYFAYIGGDWMATLSGDDRRGLCENYPSGTDDCSEDSDCEDLDDSERECQEMDEIMVCDEVRDEVGTACYLDDFNCEEVCLFDNMFYTEGQCTLSCPEGSCDEGFDCQEASYTLPLEPGTVCVPVEADTGLDTGDTAPPDDTGPTEDDTGEGEPDDCGCASRVGAPWALLPLALLALGTARRRYDSPLPPPSALPLSAPSRELP